MAMKKKGAANGGVRKMKEGGKAAAEKQKIEDARAKARKASNEERGELFSPTSKKRRAALEILREKAKERRKIKLMSKGVGSASDRKDQAQEVYDNTGIRDSYEQPSHLGGRKRKITDANTMPNGMPKIDGGRRYNSEDAARGFKGGGRMKAKGAAVGGRMKAKGAAVGGRMKAKGAAVGGQMKQPTADQAGLKKLPTDVRNKMGYAKNGGRMKSKGMSKGGRAGGAQVSGTGFKGTF